VTAGATSFHPLRTNPYIILPRLLHISFRATLLRDPHKHSADHLWCSPKRPQRLTARGPFFVRAMPWQEWPWRISPACALMSAHLPALPRASRRALFGQRRCDEPLYRVAPPRNSRCARGLRCLFELPQLIARLTEVLCREVRSSNPSALPVFGAGVLLRGRPFSPSAAAPP
jgi:hypothetical protein